MTTYHQDRIFSLEVQLDATRARLAEVERAAAAVLEEVRCGFTTDDPPPVTLSRACRVLRVVVGRRERHRDGEGARPEVMA